MLLFSNAIGVLLTSPNGVTCLPFLVSQWMPATEEEKEDCDQSDIDNAQGAARRCMDLVRKRKGLPVQEKLVAAAEKQRTRSKRK